MEEAVREAPIFFMVPPSFFAKKVGKLLFPIDEIMRFGIQKILSYYIGYSHYSVFDTYVRSYVFEYCAEAIRAGVVDGPELIPRALIRYACIDTLYSLFSPLLPSSCPESVAKAGISARIIFALARTIFVRHMLSLLFDQVIAEIVGEQEDEDPCILNSFLE